MEIDYGEIRVQIHKGLTLDQKVTIIKNAVENQLITDNRSHYIEILDKCISVSNVLDSSFEILFINQYKFKFKMDVL